MTPFEQQLTAVRACQICAQFLEPRPMLQLAPSAQILIAGQAPGKKVHSSGILFDDASGERLRDWLGVTATTFYDPTQFAILPMGFCYPGSGKSGDLAPRPECAQTWRAPLLADLAQLKLTLIIGRYALAYHLPQAPQSITAAVKAWRTNGPKVMVLPHPSPRNNPWLKQNPWFANEVLPELRQRVAALISVKT
ncbi:uracil-DNA glycosylase family protein [Deefgea salmonis]|uniref:Uracil-DNA glycosylase family protein n=1 Tax=Deefgea salmonis TaxID=2875502 RepID=A0ABS8BJY8_9NEIS|nr:uracil-DNA glycosylase family protein [Deefgea salmonis]MCB5196014.1 uracil-DNA glycosylase family protein [Deefgea salmonis]